MKWKKLRPKAWQKSDNINSANTKYVWGKTVEIFGLCTRCDKILRKPSSSSDRQKKNYTDLGLCLYMFPC